MLAPTVRRFPFSPEASTQKDRRRNIFTNNSSVFCALRYEIQHEGQKYSDPPHLCRSPRLR
jgi:hypothetical protein